MVEKNNLRIYSEVFNKVLDKARNEGLEICQIQEGNRIVSGNAYLAYIPKKILENSLTPEGTFNPRFMVYLKNNFLRKRFPHLNERELPEEVRATRGKFSRSIEHDNIDERMKEGKSFVESLKSSRLEIGIFDLTMPIAANKDLGIAELNNLLDQGYTHLWTKYLTECFDNHW